MDNPLQSLLYQGKIPALEFLLKSGQYFPNMISSFPTMSVVVDSTLLTGTYSNKHKVPALVWYDTDNKRFISYGSAKKEVLKIGIKSILKESVYNLNHLHLSGKVQTIHEDVEEQTSSINTLVYRGENDKRLQLPCLLKFFNVLKGNETVQGPASLSYGILSKINPRNKYTHFWQGFGFNDRFATEEIIYLLKQNRLPAFSLVYFSDNDKIVHKKGENETKGIEKADKQLQNILNCFSSWEKAIEDIVWIVMGDSGQTDIGDNKKRSLIDLRAILRDFNIYKLGKPIQEKDQLVLGLNERMSFIYILDTTVDLKEIVNILAKDSRIDHIAWKQQDEVSVVSYLHHGEFSFKPIGEYVDSYGQTWTINGNPKLLDLQIDENKQIQYNDYPDGLMRLYSAFYSHKGNYIIVNAKPGFEFIGEGSPTHVGGASHGSLHKQDTYFPMIVVGTDEKPRHMRMVDFKEYICRILNS